MPPTRGVLQGTENISLPHRHEALTDGRREPHHLRQAGKLCRREEAEIPAPHRTLVLGELSGDRRKIGPVLQSGGDLADPLLGGRLPLHIEPHSVVGWIDDDVRDRHSGLNRKLLRVGVEDIRHFPILHLQLRVRLLRQLLNGELLPHELPELLFRLIGLLQLGGKGLFRVAVLLLVPLDILANLVVGRRDLLSLRPLEENLLRDQIVERLHPVAGKGKRRKLVLLAPELLGDDPVDILDQDLRPIDDCGHLFCSSGDGPLVPPAGGAEEGCDNDEGDQNQSMLGSCVQHGFQLLVVRVARSSSPVRGKRMESASSSQGNGIDLDPDIPWKPGRLDGGTGGSRRAKRLGIDGIDRAEVAQIGEEDRGADHLLQRAARRRQNRPEIRQHLPGLRLDPSVHDLHCRGIERNLPRDEDQPVGPDCLGVGANRLRGKVGLDRFDLHSLSSIIF